jgi:hypothetical protein
VGISSDNMLSIGEYVVGGVGGSGDGGVGGRGGGSKNCGVVEGGVGGRGGVIDGGETN